MSKTTESIDKSRRKLLGGRISNRLGPKPTDEVHIASLLVQARPALLADIADKIARLPGAEVHASDPRGKILVTLESGSQGSITDSLNRIQGIDGVISAALVYHQVDGPENEPEKEGQETP